MHNRSLSWVCLMLLLSLPAAAQSSRLASFTQDSSRGGVEGKLVGLVQGRQVPITSGNVILLPSELADRIFPDIESAGQSMQELRQQGASPMNTAAAACRDALRKMVEGIQKAAAHGTPAVELDNTGRFVFANISPGDYSLLGTGRVADTVRLWTARIRVTTGKITSTTVPDSVSECPDPDALVLPLSNNRTATSGSEETHDAQATRSRSSRTAPPRTSPKSGAPPVPSAPATRAGIRLPERFRQTAFLALRAINDIPTVIPGRSRLPQETQTRAAMDRVNVADSLAKSAEEVEVIKSLRDFAMTATILRLTEENVWHELLLIAGSTGRRPEEEDASGYKDLAAARQKYRTCHSHLESMLRSGIYSAPPSQCRKENLGVLKVP